MSDKTKGEIEKIIKPTENIENGWKDYKLHLTVLVLVIIAEFIGTHTLQITEAISLVVMPLLYSIIMALALYLSKPIKWIGKIQSKYSEEIMLLLTGPLLAKLAISSGQSISIIFSAGPALLLQELGNLGTIFVAMPIALFLGFKRESIGMTSSICREPQLPVIIKKYGFASEETRGVLIVFLIGTIIGAIFISFMVSILAAIIPLHPYAYAMASGIGSASMNAAAISSLVSLYPTLSSQIQAFAGISNLISMCSGIYVYIFIALPLSEKIYSILEPLIDERLLKRGND
ncbi:MAG: DUF3100 domain-containing protein [Methanobacteriaceae archaeon]|nr:DUF3100 domain-containing protein [Methanobacteriaceae archaeon]